MMRTMNNMRKYGNGSSTTSKIVELAYKGTAVLDNWTKAVTFDAVYQSRLDEGYSDEEAVRLAVRAVQDTQPASSAREMTAFNRMRGFPKLALFQFMNALAPVFNVGVVDVARNLRHPSWNGIKAAAWSALGAGLAIGFAGFIKGALSGDWPTGDERPDGDTDDWDRWTVDTELENLLNSVPIWNSILVHLYRGYRGNKQYRSTNRVTEPFEAASKAISSLWGSEDEEEDKGFDWDSAFKAMSLLGVPIPYSGGRQIMQWLGAFDDID